MDDQEYINKRLDDQINWYSDKANHYKRWFWWMQILEVIAAASIPVLIHYDTTKFCVPTVSAVVVVMTSLLGILRFREEWVLYRATE